MHKLNGLLSWYLLQPRYFLSQSVAFLNDQSLCPRLLLLESFQLISYHVILQCFWFWNISQTWPLLSLAFSSLSSSVTLCSLVWCLCISSLSSPILGSLCLSKTQIWPVSEKCHCLSHSPEKTAQASQHWTWAFPPGVGNGNPLQHSCLDRIPWTEEPGGLQSMGSRSGTRLSGFHFHSPTLSLTSLLCHSPSTGLFYVQIQPLRPPPSSSSHPPSAWRALPSLLTPLLLSFKRNALDSEAFWATVDMGAAPSGRIPHLVLGAEFPHGIARLWCNWSFVLSDSPARLWVPCNLERQFINLVFVHPVLLLPVNPHWMMEWTSAFISQDLVMKFKWEGIFERTLYTKLQV